MRPRPIATVLLAVLPCGAIMAQSTPAPAAEVLQAIAELDTPARRAHAFAVIDAAGAGALPALRETIAKAASGLDNVTPPRGVTLGVLLVLRRLGARAADLQPDVLDLAQRTGDDTICDQAILLTALLTIGKPLNERRQIASRLQQHRANAELLGHANMLLVVPWDAAPLRPYLEAGGVYTAAAAQVLPTLPAERREDVVEPMRALLHQAMTREAHPWEHELRYDYAVGELAVALAGPGQAAATSHELSRGLLASWDPAQRERGLRGLADARDLTAPERLDIVNRLWDEEPPIAELARATLLGHGARGIVALRPMRAFERDPATKKRAILFRRAAESLVQAACAEATPATAAMVHAADRALRGEPDAPPETDADEAACHVLAEIVVGCRGADDDALPALARLAVATHALAVDHDHALADAFLGNLAVFTPAAWQQAARALCELGAGALEHVGDVPTTLAAAHAVYGACIPDEGVFLLEAGIDAGPRASTVTLRQLLASPRWHVAFTALARLVERGATIADDATAVRTLATHEYEDLHLFAGPNPSQAFSPPRMYLRALSAVALVQAGDEPWDLDGTTDAIATMFDLQKDDVPASLRAAREHGELPAMAKKLRHCIDTDPPGALID